MHTSNMLNASHKTGEAPVYVLPKGGEEGEEVYGGTSLKNRSDLFSSDWNLIFVDIGRESKVPSVAVTRLVSLLLMHLLL